MMRFIIPLILAVVAALVSVQLQCKDVEDSDSLADAMPQMTAGDRFWLLREACQHGDEIGVRILLRLGADVDGFNDYREFRKKGYVEDSGWGVEPSWPINQAAWHGHSEIVRILIDEGAKLDSFEGEGNTALINAAYKGHIDIVKMLLEAGADPKLKGVNGWTPADAAREGHHDEVYDLLFEVAKKTQALSNDYEVPRFDGE